MQQHITNSQHDINPAVLSTIPEANLGLKKRGGWKE